MITDRLLASTLAALLAACTGSDPAVEGPRDLTQGTDAAPSADLAKGSPLDEEFNGAELLGGLKDLYPQLHDQLPLAGAAGRLALTPVAVAYTHWYSDNEGPFLYKTLTGDFVVETDLLVGRRDDRTQPPRGAYNAGGLLVRDPASARRAQRWLMYNLGHQVNSFAREAKTTRPGAQESLSSLFLVRAPDGARGGKLRICRLGQAFHLLHQHPGEAGWVEEAYDAATTPMGNGAGEPAAGVVPGGVIRFLRPDLPATVQVGVVVGAWEAPLETRAEFDYLRFGAPRSLADCAAPLR